VTLAAGCVATGPVKKMTTKRGTARSSAQVVTIRSVSRAEVRAEEARQRLRLAKRRLKRARKQLKAAKREAKRSRKQAAAVSRAWKQTQRPAVKTKRIDSPRVKSGRKKAAVTVIRARTSPQPRKVKRVTAPHRTAKVRHTPSVDRRESRDSAAKVPAVARVRRSQRAKPSAQAPTGEITPPAAGIDVAGASPPVTESPVPT
jgi:hypothetical protein